MHVRVAHIITPNNRCGRRKNNIQSAYERLDSHYYYFLFQMQCLFAVLALVVLSFAEANPIRDPEPEFCHGLECPHFKTINTTDKYEVRCYQTAYKWVSTVVAGKEFVLMSRFLGTFLALLLAFSLQKIFLPTRLSRRVRVAMARLLTVLHAVTQRVHRETLTVKAKERTRQFLNNSCLSFLVITPIRL